jgi:FtsZ-binding cell division protein ZapB
MEKMQTLEDKIRRAADRIRSLREERDILEEQLRSARDELRRISGTRPDPELDRQLTELQEERQVIAQRIERMINLIEEVEAS